MQLPFTRIHFLKGVYRIAEGADAISRLEVAIATAAAFGYSNAQIGGLHGINIGENSVTNHLSIVYKKLEVPTRNAIMSSLLGNKVLALAKIGDPALLGLKERDKEYLSLCDQGRTHSEIAVALQYPQPIDAAEHRRELTRRTGISAITALVTAAISVGDIRNGAAPGAQ
jgi:DNA-binding CsgD family transcriptional regulator